MCFSPLTAQLLVLRSGKAVLSLSSLVDNFVYNRMDNFVYNRMDKMLVK
ncbi:hypothetical protein [Acinetobacter sp.]|nr:hypothetical protein [Acinetobacter sp.]MDR2248770.1 hypothetical protein [Acinetobacter sp.]